MKTQGIQFPGYMERCSGFTIPDSGVFFALYFEECLARFDISSGKAELIEDGELRVIDDLSLFVLDGVTHRFVGFDGAHAVHRRDEFGELSLERSQVTLHRPDGSTRRWRFESFSGDWEQVTFDVSREAFLFGAPYDFDFRYVDLAER